MSQRGTDEWNVESAKWRNSFWFFFARAISNICAPSFFFTMGMGMTLFSLSRLENHWSYARILKHFGVRSLTIFFVDRISIYGFFFFRIISLLEGKAATVPGSSKTLFRNDVGTFLLNSILGYHYVMSGIGYGFMAKTDFPKLLKGFRILSVGLLVIIVVVRLFFSTWGNLRCLPRGDGGVDDVDRVSWVIEFFYTSKFSPSIAYASWTMSVNFGLVCLFAQSTSQKLLITPKEEASDTNPRSVALMLILHATKILHVFGMVPLMFLIAHPYLISCCGTVLGLLFLGPRIFLFKHLISVVPFWLLVIVILVPICRRYSAFKSTTPLDSWWRLL